MMHLRVRDSGRLLLNNPLSRDRHIWTTDTGLSAFSFNYPGQIYNRYILLNKFPARGEGGVHRRYIMIYHLHSITATSIHPSCLNLIQHATQPKAPRFVVQFARLFTLPGPDLCRRPSCATLGTPCYRTTELRCLTALRAA